MADHISRVPAVSYGGSTQPARKFQGPRQNPWGLSSASQFYLSARLAVGAFPLLSRGEVTAGRLSSTRGCQVKRETLDEHLSFLSRERGLRLVFGKLVLLSVSVLSGEEPAPQDGEHPRRGAPVPSVQCPGRPDPRPVCFIRIVAASR